MHKLANEGNTVKVYHVREVEARDHRPAIDNLNRMLIIH